ncbi:Uncharacterised protein [Streptococcus pneumoniae]|nr:Uncharacterised protein [Streptococcus pneumoniae]
MNDEASKQLTDARFKRLVGVQREVTLVQSGVTISRTPLSSEDTVMIDATEVKRNATL